MLAQTEDVTNDKKPIGIPSAAELTAMLGEAPNKGGISDLVPVVKPGTTTVPAGKPDTTKAVDGKPDTVPDGVPESTPVAVGHLSDHPSESATRPHKHDAAEICPDT